MDALNNRFKQLREFLDMSQEEFGNLIGITRSGVSNIESGVRRVNEKHIKLLSLSRNINEEWLRTGNGEIFNEQSENDKIAAFIGDVQSGLTSPLAKAIILSLAKRKPEEWVVFEKMLDDINTELKAIKKD